MEIGNKIYLLFFIVPMIILFVMVIGYNKKQNILNKLNLRTKTFIESTKIACMVLGAVFVVIALLSPQKLLDEGNEDVKGMNIYALIDVSRSMMTEDVYPNRLEAAKRVLTQLLQDLKGDRIGFIPYSDSAYIQMPLTDDYSIGKNYINAIDSELISGGGTQLYEGLVIAERSFEEIQSENKTVLLLSDGGDNDERSLEFAKQNNITVYCVGIGTSEGGIVPDYTNGVKTGFIKDTSGSAVISRINSGFMKKLADENNGHYYEVNNLQNDFNKFFADIINVERKTIRDEKVKIYKKYFQIPLGIGILLLLIAYLLKGRVKDER